VAIDVLRSLSDRKSLINLHTVYVSANGAADRYLGRFGRRVRELRLRAKLSQEQFAAECDLDRTYISGIERGKRNVALRNIEKIAETLRISLAELMRGI